MSAVPAGTVCWSSVAYGPFTLAAVCSCTLTFGYFTMNALSMAVIAETAGGFTQVMSFSVPEMLELDPVLVALGVVELELQAALNIAIASAADPASAGLAHLRTDMRVPPFI